MSLLLLNKQAEGLKLGRPGSLLLVTMAATQRADHQTGNTRVPWRHSMYSMLNLLDVAISPQACIK